MQRKFDCERAVLEIQFVIESVMLQAKTDYERKEHETEYNFAKEEM